MMTVRASFCQMKRSGWENDTMRLVVEAMTAAFSDQDVDEVVIR